MSERTSAGERIAEAVLSWPGVERAAHRFGGVEFRLGKRELGHVHGDRLVDLPFPRKVRDELVAAGRARPHHVLPDSGWVSFWIESADDAEQAVALFRLGYERAVAARARARASTP
jgi:Luciferase